MVPVGQDGSRRHRSVVHAPCVTLEILVMVARDRQCRPLDTPNHTDLDCGRPSLATE
jgi:hypothetical protein